MVAFAGGFRAPFYRYWLSGFLSDVAAGAGAAALTGRVGPWRSLLAAGLAMAVTQAALGLTSSVIVAALLQVLSSAAFALFNVTAVTMRQRQVPTRCSGGSAASTAS